MGNSKQKQFDKQSGTRDASLAKALAPEDIRVGDFVTMLHTIAELPSCFWCADTSTLPAHEPIRIQFMPVRAGIPLKVQSICLPFVLVKRPFGDQQTFDVRQCRCARISREFALEAWKACKQDKSKRKPKSKRKRR